MSKLILDSIFFYYQNLKVLQGVYLEVEREKITCLVGKNGSGKSTLFKIAAGQLQADSGVTFIKGNRFHQPSKKERFEHIAYLPQKPFLPIQLKVKDLIDEDVCQNDEVIQRIKNNKVKELSTGERRYVEIFFVLSLNRDFVLLDEPFTGLSPILIERVIGHIQKINQKGIGILISDHYMRYIVDVGEVFYLLETGQVKILTSEEN